MFFHFRIKLLFGIVFVTSSLSEDVDINFVAERAASDEDYILCRNCGSDISSADYIISKSSPESLYTFNDTLFKKDRVLIQVLSSDIFFHYPVFTTTQSTCISVGEWDENDSWFPGYHWKPCVCPECGAYIGFVFEPIGNNYLTASKRIFGLILTNVIGESFTDSLTLYPGPESVH